MPIARLWRTAVVPGRVRDYERFAAEISLPMFQAQPGFTGAIMMREGGDCVVLTLWKDEASVSALARSDSYLETVRRIRAQGFLVGEQVLRTYDTHVMAIPATAA